LHVALAENKICRLCSMVKGVQNHCLACEHHTDEARENPCSPSLLPVLDATGGNAYGWSVHPGLCAGP
jgi:hypothetical protein